MKPKFLVPAFLIAVFFAGPSARAQTGSAWPSKPVRWIVPFPPGGPADVVTRMLAAKLTERVGQPVVVENRGGAGGNVGHDAAAKSTPDGYTLLFVVPAIITNPYYLKVSIDPFRELGPVMHVDSASMALLTSIGFPANSVADVIAMVRAKPGSVSCAASGALPQVGCEILRSHAGADMIMVQYKGNAPALSALVSGEVNLLFDVVNTAQGQVKSGRVRAIATTSPKRGTGYFAELPALVETVPDGELVTWHGVMVPAATPRDVVLRINRELQAVLEQPDIRKRFADTGLDIAGGPPEAFEAVLRREYAKYGRILKRAGVKPE